MNEKTAQALQAVDRSFYEDCADTFAATRSRPWSGFSPILAHAQQPLSVLDLGCGNGRFAQMLAAEAHVDLYVGVDQSDALLQHARTLELPFPTDFYRGDLLSSQPCGPERQFSLVVMFGLMHHIPSFARRQALLRHAASRVAPRGILAVSFYRYDRSPRMMRRRIDPSEHLELGVVAAVELEDGDFLIPFGDTGRMRYCHLFTDDEVEALAPIEGLTLLERFAASEASDKLNDYLVWKRAG